TTDIYTFPYTTLFRSLCPMDNDYVVVKVEHPRKPVCNVPHYTTEKEIVEEWLEQGHEVVARTVLNGNSGEGIVLLQPGDDIVDRSEEHTSELQSRENL